MTTAQKKTEQQEAIRELKRYLRPGSTVYTALVHRSRSGMYRVIDLFVMRRGRPIRISWLAAKLLEGYDHKHGGCKASGCGMDMGFHLVYSLGFRLFPKGARKWSRNRNGDGGPERSGGYCLDQRWM